MFSIGRIPDSEQYKFEEGKNAKHLPLNLVLFTVYARLRTVDRFTCTCFDETVAHLFCKFILKFSDLKRRKKTQSNENRIRKLNVHGAMSISRIFSTVFLSVSRCVSECVCVQFSFYHNHIQKQIG